MKLQLKRSSSTTGEAGALRPVEPTPSQTLYGELCVNFNAGDPALYIEDSGGNIRRLDGNSDNYALSTTTSTSQGDIVLTHKVQGDNDATTDTVSIVAGTNIAVSSDGTDITIASSVPASGQFGYWTRDNVTNTLSPVNTNDNVSIGSGQFTTTTQYNGPKLTNAGGILEISTTSTADPVGDHDIDINASGTGQVLVNTDVVIENGHELVLNQPAIEGVYHVAHKAEDSISANTTYTWPVAPSGITAYLTSSSTGALSWTNIAGVLTTVNGAAGITSTATNSSSTTISVDLKANQGIRTIDPGSLADSALDNSKLGLIAGSNPQDTLLWTVENGARELVESGGEVVVSGNTAQPEGRYVGVTTTATTGSGCTINFDVDSSGVITNLTIANPGSGYGESQVLTIDGHQTLGPPPADITFTLETDANNGRYTYTGWRTGALTTAGGGGSGGDVVGIDGGPGIEIDESNTTTPKVSIDLAATNPGLEFTAADDTGELRVKPHNGITVGSSGVAAVGNQGITVDGDGISVDIANNSGLEFTGTAPNETLQVKDYHGITVSNNGVSVTAHNGIEVSNDGVSTRIHVGGALSDTLGSSNNELGLADPSSPNTSNQVVVWKAAGAVDTIELAGTPNNVSNEAAADYINVPTVNDAAPDPVGSGLTVNFTVGNSGQVTNLNISNPGSGYNAATPVCSVSGHGNLKIKITALFTAAQWIAEPFAGGGGSGGGDVTGVQAGDGIDVATSDGPEPVVSVDVHANGGLTNRFDAGASANEGELGLTPGTADGQVMMWDATNSAWSPQTNVVNTNTTYDLTNASVTSGSRLDLTDSGGNVDSVSITGSGATTVTHGNGTIQISSVNTSTILVQDGSDSVPTAADYGEGQLWWNSDADVGKLFVLYDDPDTGSGDTGGKVWVEASPKPEVPDIFPDLSTPGNQGDDTLDKRYLRIEAGAGAQTVASTSRLNLMGNVHMRDQLLVVGPEDATMAPSSAIITCKTGNENGIYIGNKGSSDNYASYIQSAFISDSNEVNYKLYLNPRGGEVHCGQNFVATGNITSNGRVVCHPGVGYDGAITGAFTIDAETLGEVRCFANGCTAQPTATKVIGYNSNIVNGAAPNGTAYNFYAQGNAPNYFLGETRIGGSPTAGNITLTSDGSGLFENVVSASRYLVPSNLQLNTQDTINLINGSIKGDFGIYGYRFLPNQLENNDSSKANEVIHGVESSLVILGKAPNYTSAHLFNAVGVNGNDIDAPNLKRVYGFYSYVMNGASGVHADYQAYNLYIHGDAPNAIYGSVGIGTSLPGCKFEVIDNNSRAFIKDSLNLFKVGTGNKGAMYFGAIVGDPTGGIECGWGDGDNNPQLAIGVARGLADGREVPRTRYEYTGGLYHVTNGIDRMVITASGNVGIGKDPAVKLDVDGVISAANVVFRLAEEDEANYTTDIESYEGLEEIEAPVAYAAATYDEEGNELTAEVPAVEGTYQTVPLTREVRRYTGPVLSLKDALQEALDKIEVLEQRLSDAGIA